MHAIVVSSEEVVGVEEEPTGAQADSDAALMAELNQICAIQEKLYEEEFGQMMVIFGTISVQYRVLLFGRISAIHTNSNWQNFEFSVLFRNCYFLCYEFIY